MGDYGKLSNFNSKANFSMVRFGADTPITECELNEVQQIQDYKHKQLSKVIGDRFTKVGTMEVVEPLEEEESAKLILVNSDVIVEGNAIHIDQLSTPIEEGQTAYLKVSEKDIDKDSNIKAYGNEQGEEIENDLLDPRLEGIETARRKQICYDIDVQNTLATHPKQTVEGELKLNATKGDYIDNIAFEGETLVNLRVKSTWTQYTDSSLGEMYYSRSTVNSFKENTKYTLVNLTDKVIVFEIRTTTSPIMKYSVSANSKLVIDTTELDLNNYNNNTLTLLVSNGWVMETTSQTYADNGFVLLEGDHTDKPISYFEGLKSVGQGDKIDVLSYKRGSENLASNLTFTEGEFVDSVEGGTHSHEEFKYSNEYIEVEGGCEYLFDNINGQFAIYDSSKNIISTSWEEIQDSWFKGDSYQSSFIYAMPKNAKYIRINLPISNLKPYSLIKTKSDKKQILTTLRSLPNGVKDTIEKQGNKYYKVKRCEEIVLDSTMTWSNGNQQTNTRAFRCDTFPTLKAKPLSSLYCDRFKEKTVEGELQEDTEFIYCNTSGSGVKFFVRMYTSKLGSSDVESFKTWLKTNPITVVYELEEPIIEELPNFNPELFEGENTIILNSGVIQKDMNFNHYEYLVPVFEEDTTYIPLIQIHQGKVKDLRITDPNRVNYKMEGKDNSNGQFTKVIQTRQNGTIKRISELSEKVGDNYTKLTVHDYDDLGTTIVLTEMYKLDYDNEGDLIGQELIERC